jgi:phosphatidylglycerol:prolipoprotein diacylglycerol transferase
MIPIIFEIGPFKLHSFGLMMALSFLVTTVLAARRFRAMGRNADPVTELGLGAMVGGVLGAKIYYLLDHLEMTIADPWPMIFSGSGLTWYGGFVGGVLGTLLVARWRKIPLLWLCDFSGPFIALGYAIGRMGCFLNGDDYGRPTDVPWAMTFPKGAPPTTTPVHPTQLYEVAGGVLTYFLLSRISEKHYGTGMPFGLYLVMAGVARIVVEVYRTNEPLALGLTMAQWISTGLVIVGLGLIARGRGTTPRSAARD